MISQPTIFDASRSSLEDSIELTVQSLIAYGGRHKRWALAFSGGKDSSALLTLVVWLVETGRVPQPERMDVLYGDTRMELIPLWLSAKGLMDEMAKRSWIHCKTVVAPLDQRFFVYMLGRGVPPPNNNTLRWCTAQIKVEPMEAELVRLAQESPEKPLMLIGVRLGESAARDGRIAVACSRNGAECGQGWYQRDLPDAVCDKLSPILHMRACQVWDWLMQTAGDSFRHGFPTQLVAQAYGQDADGSSLELNARTGCLGCPLATEDVALEGLIKRYPTEWGYLAPLRGLRPIYRTLREPGNRLRQPGGERRKDGSLVDNQNRMGPLTMQARGWALNQIIDIQSSVNVQAALLGRPEIDILNVEERCRIEQLIMTNTWPQRWTGDEPVADLPYEDHYADGSKQSLLPIFPTGGAK